MTHPITGMRDASGERHPLRDVLLGLWAVLGPLLSAARAPAPAAPPTPASTDGALVDILLGALALAWRLEGVLLAAAAAAPPSPPAAPPGDPRILR